MVNFINSWMKGIILAIVITIIIEMILPENKNKKYIKSVIGIYIIFTIISPIFTKLTKKTIDVSKIIDKYEIPELEVNKIDNEKLIEETYKDKLKFDITKKLENMGYLAYDVVIDINTEEEGFGEIEKISLSVKKNENDNVKKIKDINIDLKDKEKQVNKITEAERSEISTFLVINYGIDEENISIEEN